MLITRPVARRLVTKPLKGFPYIIGKKAGGGTGPGPGTPAWVPAGALFYIDFMNKRAWDGTNTLDANGIGTLLGNDPVVDTYQGGSAYNPAAIGPQGYDYNLTGEGVSFAAKGALKTKLVSGATVVNRVLLLPDWASITPSMAFIEANSRAVHTYSDYNTNDYLILDNQAPLGTLSNVLVVGQVNCLAHTYTPTRFEIAVNGSAASPFVINYSAAGVYNDGTPFQSIAVYNPVPVGQLPALSV